MKRLQVVKVGGAALADSCWLETFAAHARDGAPRIIVHGGGPEVSALSATLGIPVEWVNGRRVTSEAALNAARMVLSGSINKRIVAALYDAGVDAVGVSGEDAGLVAGVVAHGGALGRVGEVKRVRVSVLHRFLDAGLCPVLAPISRDVGGGALNINADEVATAVAVAVHATELLFLTDVPAVRDENGDRAELGAAEAESLIARGVATGGMAVKLEAALKALKSGVGRVRVGPVSMMNDERAGTVIRPEVAACR